MKVRARLALVPLLAILFAANVASAQDYGQPPPPDYGQAYEQAPAAQPFNQEELEQMLAPIALYPDSLLSQILMASTYPLEVVEAARWSRANPGLQGDQAVAAAAQFDWDPSVKSLTAFPQILLVMDQRLDWIQRLGDAFLAQQAQVMDTVQYLRRKAYDAGNLRTNEEIQVQPVAQTIDISFANPEVVYVPYYDPTVVYGPWWWPNYPPVYWAPWPGYLVGYQPGLYWGPAIGVSFGFFFGNVDWHRHRVDVIHNDYYDRRFARHRFGGHEREGITRWRHEPEHRRNLPYRSPEVRQRFAPENRPAEPRERYRGYQAPHNFTGVPMNREVPRRETPRREFPNREAAPRRTPQPRVFPNRETAPRRTPQPRVFPNRETAHPRAPQPAQRAVPKRNAPARVAPRPAIRPAPERRPGASEAVPRGEHAREFNPRGHAQEHTAPRRAPAARAITPAARPPAPATRPRVARPPAARPPAPATKPRAARPPARAPAPRTTAPKPPERPAEHRREER